MLNGRSYTGSGGETRPECREPEASLRTCEFVSGRFHSHLKSVKNSRTQILSYQNTLSFLAYIITALYNFFFFDGQKVE